MKFFYNHFSAMSPLGQKWMGFMINYRWSDWSAYIDGWIPKFALFFPAIGYLILFNDAVSDVFSFDYLANEEILNSGLNGENRLKFLYFSLLFLGLSNFIYRFKKPFVMRLGNNSLEYAKAGLEHFTISNYVQINERIKYDGHASLDGKYYDSEWEGFLKSSRNTDEGTELVKRDGNWEEAKKQYGNLLRSMLRDNFYFYDSKRRIWLSLCILISSIGYVLLAIPSLDIFIKVVKSLFV